MLWRASGSRLFSDTMNQFLWPGPRPAARLRSACALSVGLGLALALAVSPLGAQVPSAQSAPAAPPTLRQALDAAWQRSSEEVESRGRQARAQADQAIAQSWLAAPPSVELSQREGLGGAPAGSRETELGVALPLWRPGQRAAGEQAAQAQSAWSRAVEQAERLRLAGRLREAVSAAQLAAVDLQQAERQTETLRQLAEDVQRRVAAGDLAPADALAARAELLAAQAQARAARQGVQAQRSAWRLLTGLESLPVDEPAALAPEMANAAAVPDAHPDWVFATAAVGLGQRRLDLARGYRPDAPELAVALRQASPGQGASAQGAVTFSLRLPVGGAAHLQPRITAAQGELDLAEVQARRTRERLAAEIQLASSQLQSSQAQLQAEEERAALLADRARLIDKSFRAGESPLPELLRALASAAAAEGARARQQVARQQAAARLQHALGWLP